MKLPSSKNDETPVAPTIEVSNLSVTPKELTMKIIAKEKSDFTIFRFGNSEIRVVDKAGDPWFVAADICKALDLSNPSKSVAALDEDEKDVLNSDPNFKLGSAGSGPQSMNIVSESGMYTLVLRCRNAVSKGSVPHSFRKWVTAEVLPAIRKTGSYKKARKTTVDERTPLRDAVNMLVSKKHLMYPEAYSMIHQRFNVESIEDLEATQIRDAVEYIHKIAIEGEWMPKEEDISASDFTAEVNNMAIARLHLDYIYEVWKNELHPSLKMMGSPIAGKLYDRIVDAGAIVSSLQASMESKTGIKGVIRLSGEIN